MTELKDELSMNLKDVTEYENLMGSIVKDLAVRFPSIIREERGVTEDKRDP